MGDIAARTQPRDMRVAASRRVSPPYPIPKSLQHLRGARLSLETFSPVTENGCFEFDRIIKAGRVLKRTRKTKSWKPVFIVLRPNLLSMYRDENETKLRNQVRLSELTAVARQKDPKRRDKHVFGLFTPSRNYHLEASSDAEAQEWVEHIRREARLEQAEEEMMLASPGGARSPYHGFERSIDASMNESMEDHTSGGGHDVAAFSYLPKSRERGHSNLSAQRLSHVEYSGGEGHGSYSDLSETASPAARMSVLSLAYTEGRPSTSSTAPAQTNSIYGSISSRPPVEPKNPSQLSTSGPGADAASHPPLPRRQDQERVVYHGWILLLKSKSGVRQWKKIWMVLRPKALALYKSDDEYRPLLILPFSGIIEAVEIDPISKSKDHCMQIIGEERNYRLCAPDEESLARWLGAFKSLLSKRRAAQKDGKQTTAGA